MWQNDAYDYLRLCTYYLMKDRFQKIKVSFEWMHIDAMNALLTYKKVVSDYEVCINSQL